MPLYSPDNSYRLVLSDDGSGETGTLEFEAPSAEIALHRARQQCSGREVELFEDGRSFGRVRCAESGAYWTPSSTRPAR